MKDIPNSSEGTGSAEVTPISFRKRKAIPGRNELILLLSSSIVFFLLLEFALRALGFPVMAGVGTPLTPKAALFGWAPPPDSTIYFPRPDGGRGWWERTNSAGWHDVDHKITPAPGTARILVLGDSHTYGTVPLDSLYTRLLERSLREEGINAEVISIGVGGWGTDQQLLALQHDGLNYSPNIVILQTSLNDLLEILSPYPGLNPNDIAWSKGFRFLLSNDNLISVPVPKRTIAVRERLKLFLLRSAVVWNINRIRFGLLQKSRPDTDQSSPLLEDPDFVNPYEPGELNNDTRQALRLWGALVARMRELAKGQGAHLLVLPVESSEGTRECEVRVKELHTDEQGDFQVFRGKRFPVNYSRPHELISEILRGQGVPLVQNKRKYERWQHDCHPNEEGNLAMAQDIRDFLLSYEPTRSLLTATKANGR